MSESSNKLDVTQFTRKAFYVDAVQVTSSNIEKVAEWCGGEVREGRPDRDLQNAMEGGKGLVPEKYVHVRVYRPMNDRQTKAFVGDWVLYAGKGYKVYTNSAFQNSFTAVEEEEIDRITNRSAITGRFVSEEDATANPDTTVSER